MECILYKISEETTKLEYRMNIGSLGKTMTSEPSNSRFFDLCVESATYHIILIYTLTKNIFLHIKK
jgi:hypothetical protein